MNPTVINRRATLKPRILLVDDREENLFALERSLKPLGAITDRALSGQEALSLMLQHKYSVVILDVQMPGMDGFEVATLMQGYEETRDIPVIFVTAIHKDKKYIFKGYDSGAVDYMTKPFNPEILLSKIRVFLKLDCQRNELSRALKNLERLSHRNDLILSCADEGIVGVNSAGNIAFINPAAAKMLKTDENQALGQPCYSLIAPPGCANSEAVWENSDIYATLRSGKNTRNIDEHFWNRDGDKFPVEYSVAAIREDDKCDGIVLVFQDITRRKELEQQLLRLARYDHLTNLANRTMFRDFLNGAMARAKRAKQMLAVMFLDLDNFKQINDSLGHAQGDELLIRVAERLKNAIRTGDLVARLGGDEFAIVLDNIEVVDNARLIAEKIITTLEVPHKLLGQEYIAKTSMGISVYTGDEENVDSLIKAADTAMYAAKTRGRNNFKFFSESMQKETNLKVQLGMELSKALQKNEFSTVFQPKISMQDGDIVGCEALLRWSHPEHGSVSPVVFIPIAEESSLINEIGEWVLVRSLEKVQEWHAQGIVNNDFSINVNVSVRQIHNPNFVASIDRILSEIPVDPRMIIMEVTESTLLDDTETAIQNLCSLNGFGLRLAIDDFGTGYSSLSYLKRLPFDFLKIDRSFVKDIGVDSHDEKIVTTTINLAHNLGMQVIAEGVETLEQQRFLLANECDFAQGYLYSKPLQQESFVEYLSERGDTKRAG